MKCDTCGSDMPFNQGNTLCSICANKMTDELKMARGRRFKQYLLYSGMIALLLMLSISLKENRNSDQAQSEAVGDGSELAILAKDYVFSQIKIKACNAAGKHGKAENSRHLMSVLEKSIFDEGTYSSAQATAAVQAAEEYYRLSPDDDC